MDFKQLSDVFLLPANLLIVGATRSILVTFKRYFIKTAQSAWYARIEPLLPPIISTILVFMPREATDPMRWGDKIILGIGLGMFASLGFKFWYTSIRGKDNRIKPDVQD
jgi:hypothetical protein